MRPTITLMTDFGLADPYVGIVKGVILGINSQANIVDLTHGIGPQDIMQAGWALKDVHPYFPGGTIHVIVVDPGVGTGRRIIALQAGGQIYLAPDNGVLTLVLDQFPDGLAYEITNRDFHLPHPSSTFHGRDIFAPVAGHLSLGRSLVELGASVPVHDVIRMEVPRPHVGRDQNLTGKVVAVDHFGNLITNIDNALFDRTYAARNADSVEICVRDHVIRGLSLHYMGAAEQSLLALFGSSGFLEISLAFGNAAVFLGAQTGDAVSIRPPRQG